MSTVEVEVPSAYSLHEAAHAIVAHLCGFRVEKLMIAPERARGTCDVDRGFDPDEACHHVREHSKDERSQTLLPKLKRDMAGRLAGMVGDEMYGIHGSEAEYRRDKQCAHKLARDVLHATWARSVPRPAWADRERIDAYDERMRIFVREHLLEPHRDALEALARKLEEARELSAEQVATILAEFSVPFNSLRDEDLP